MAQSLPKGGVPLCRYCCCSFGIDCMWRKGGDEVCVQSFTFCASSHPIIYLGAKPVFIDSERETWNMDPELLEKAIIERKTVTGKYPKAIIPVALYGMPYDCERIMAIADKYGISVIEDAAEGMGARLMVRCWVHSVVSVCCHSMATR